MSRINRLLGSMAFSPALWGVVASFLLVAVVRSGALSHPLLTRYVDGHASAQIVWALFFAGLGTLLSRWLVLSAQSGLLNTALLDAIPPGGQPLAACDTLLDRLEAQPAWVRNSYLVRRLRETLEYVFRKQSADTVEDEMRHLAAIDRGRLADAFVLPRRLVAATGLSGVLAAALAAADAANGDTATATAWYLLSLGLALGLAQMHCTHAIERRELQLLSAVDARVSAELVGRFELSFNPAANPQVAVLRRMGEQVASSTEQLIERQTEIWKSSFQEAQQQWSAWSAGASQVLHESLAQALNTSLQQHATTLAAASSAATELNASRWNEIQQALLQNAEAVTLQQRELVRQGEVLIQVIAATGQVEKLEEELNRNLSTLAGAKNFEQTVLSLGAAIQLLNARLGALPAPETPQVQLKAKRGAKAA